MVLRLDRLGFISFVSMRVLSFLLVTTALGGACASYPQKLAPALGHFEAGRFDKAKAALPGAEAMDSEFLAGAEAGSVALAAGGWEEARTSFTRAAEASFEIEERGLADPEAMGDTLLSWIFSDAAVTYVGEGFERVYIHTALALTYLAQGLLDDVYVEARRANALLEAEEQLYETKYAAGGFGHLLSALTYELLGEPDQAYIDYQRMQAKGVGSDLVGRALVRLAKKLSRNEDLDRWVETYGEDIERPVGAASVIVLAGVGLGPYKIESSINLPTRDGVFRMAVPNYETRPQLVEELRLVDVESGIGLRTECVENVTEVAVKNLQDRLAWLALKSAARGAAKLVFTDYLEDEHGTLGFIGGTFFTFLTERADLRAWMTLPDSWQACRLFVPPGTRTFTLEAIGGKAVTLGSFQLEPEETMFVIVRTLGTEIYAHTVGGQEVESQTTEPFGLEPTAETNP